MTLGRGITDKQVKFAFYRPSAQIIAKTFADLPLLLAQCISYTIILYFMAGMARDAGKFFIQLLFVFVSALRTNFYWILY